MLAAAPAHALTIVPVSTGPFSLPIDPSGVIPANEKVFGASTTDFTFSTLGGTYKTLMQMQASSINDGSPQNIAFTLFSGSPGSGTSVAPSGGTATAASLLWTLAPGNYYLQLVTTSTPSKGELVTGGLTLLSQVPEPATWATMIVGFGLIGLAARRRRLTAAA
jgi:hypothetical protein